MSDKLRTFLVKLGKEPQTLERFRESPDVVMDEHGLDENEKKLVTDGDRDALKKATGADDTEVKMWIV